VPAPDRPANGQIGHPAILASSSSLPVARTAWKRKPVSQLQLNDKLDEARNEAQNEIQNPFFQEIFHFLNNSVMPRPRALKLAPLESPNCLESGALVFSPWSLPNKEIFAYLWGTDPNPNPTPDLTPKTES